MKSYYSTTKRKKMSLEECLELGRRSAEGDAEAREALIVSHLYLVDQQLYMFRNNNKCVDPDDLYQEGCYGLLKAVDRYDYKYGYCFSTYAVYWIRKQIRTALSKQSIDNADTFLPGSTLSAEQEFFDKALFLDGAHLTSREKEVVSRRLAIADPEKEETLKEIAADMGLSYETIRLDYHSALKKMKIKLSEHSED